MNHLHIDDNESMHPLTNFAISIALVIASNWWINTIPSYSLSIHPSDFWELIHNLGYFVPFISLYLSVRKKRKTNKGR